MDNPLALPLIGVIALLMVSLLIVVWINKEGGEKMGFRSWYWKTFDLEPFIRGAQASRSGQPAPVQRSAPAPQRSAPVPQQPQRTAQHPDPSPRSSRPYVEIEEQHEGYVVDCSINGVAFKAVVDTGANKSKIETDLAYKLGLQSKNWLGFHSNTLPHNVDSTLADGSIHKGSSVPLTWIIGGKIKVPAVPTTVRLEYGKGGNLLGLAVLRNLDVKISNGKMRIYQK